MISRARKVVQALYKPAHPLATASRMSKRRSGVEVPFALALDDGQRLVKVPFGATTSAIVPIFLRNSSGLEIPSSGSSEAPVPTTVMSP